MFIIDSPDIALTLEADIRSMWSGGAMNLTLLFPATRHKPSEARVTERIGTSAAGVFDLTRTVSSPSVNRGKRDLTSSCEQILSDRSHCLMLPA